MHVRPVLLRIEDIFLDLTQKFGFQRYSMRNMALVTLHADYIGGQHAKYRKWYFAAQLDLDDAIGQTNNPGLNRLRSVRGKAAKLAPSKSLESAANRWRQAMNNMSP
ncbi:hypothetical protein AURDEDRAFT_163548 [Auricularia subglabra TFB-10046 SS5]|nr:hypothetical protein AURDEDRAFT_163548 [Auricularia subglabra TFB-10046 SS5]